MSAHCFDENDYREANKKIIDLIKEKNPDWQKNEGFIADGVICPSEYARQPIRVLCILAESYGYEDKGDEISIEDQPTKNVLGLGKVPTVRGLSSLLWLIQ